MRATVNDFEQYWQKEAYWEGRAEEARRRADALDHFETKRKWYELARSYDQEAAIIRALRHRLQGGTYH